MPVKNKKISQPEMCANPPTKNIIIAKNAMIKIIKNQSYQNVNLFFWDIVLKCECDFLARFFVMMIAFSLHFDNVGIFKNVMVNIFRLPEINRGKLISAN